MSFQGSINQILGSAVAYKGLNALTYDKRMAEKYGPGGKVASKIMSGVKAETIEERKLAEEKLNEYLPSMQSEALRTDKAEKEAKTLGFIPNTESRRIREEGIKRKNANIAMVQKAITDAQNAIYAQHAQKNILNDILKASGRSK